MKTQKIFSLIVSTIIVLTTFVGTTVKRNESTEPTAFKNLLRLRDLLSSVGYCVQEPTAFKNLLRLRISVEEK